MKNDFTFTSESVSEGHPDKMADQISDAILDAILAEDPMARVACETMVTTGMAIVSGEITTGRSTGGSSPIVTRRSYGPGSPCSSTSTTSRSARRASPAPCGSPCPDRAQCRSSSAATCS